MSLPQICICPTISTAGCPFHGRGASKVTDTQRLDMLLELLDGQAWNQLPTSLEWYKPDAEKYTTRESLMTVIDAALMEKEVEIEF